MTRKRKRNKSSKPRKRKKRQVTSQWTRKIEDMSFRSLKVVYDKQILTIFKVKSFKIQLNQLIILSKPKKIKFNECE